MASFGMRNTRARGAFGDRMRPEDVVTRGRYGARMAPEGAAQSEQPFAVDDINLETPDPLVNVRGGQFGAGALDKNPLRQIGGVLLDVSAGLRGGNVGYSQGYEDEYNQQQAAADYAAQLDGMGLDPEVRTFADANPEAFRTMQFEEYQAGKKRDEQLGLLEGLGLPEDVMARAMINPAGFMEEYGKQAAEVQTDTFFDPLTGKWSSKPIMGQNGDSLFRWDGEGDPEFLQRPKSYDELENERSARVEESLTGRQLGISERNAETARINATRPPPSPAPSGRPRSIIDDPNGPPPIPDGSMSPTEIRSYQRQDGGVEVEGLVGGKLFRTAVGSDGRYAATDGDPEIPQGKMFPPPSYSTVEGLGDKAGPTINLEQKKMQAARDMRDSAVLLKSLSDKYITQSEGYPFGAMIWDTGRQMVDPRTPGLEGLNAQMALEVGKMAKGAMSDKDREFFVMAAPNAKGKPESNAVFAMRNNAVANNLNQYVTFLQQYRSEYGVGSLDEAERYWNMYSLANPIFDDNGDAIDGRMTYTEFFTGKRAGRDDIFERDYPGVRGDKGGGLSAAEQQELEQLKRELGL